MSHAHTYVDEHVFSHRIAEDIREHLPAVNKGIIFDYLCPSQWLLGKQIPDLR